MSSEVERKRLQRKRPYPAGKLSRYPRWVLFVFPFLAWFEGYGRDSLWADAIAGVTVALVLVPQSMAYAQLAGLPPYYGLYAALVPSCVAALWGSSRLLATGPVAMISLMTAAALGAIAESEEAYIAYAFLMAVMVGVILLVLGLLRLGVIINLVSHPVIVGFTNAAALIIASSQLASLLGVSVTPAEKHFITIYRVIAAGASHAHWPTMGMGVLAIAIMVGLKRVHPKMPVVFIAVVVTTVLSFLLGFERNEVATLEQLATPEIRENIVKYNQSMDELAKAKRKEVGLNKKIKAVQEDGNGRLDIIHLNYEQALQRDYAHEMEEEAGVYRDRLRRASFEVRESDGARQFHLRTESTDPEKEVWRLRIGKQRVAEDHLVMMAGGRVVGNVPSGLPKPVIPGQGVDLSNVRDLFVMALLISLIGFMEAISIAKAIASRTGQRVDPNRELIGQGLSNISAGFFQGYPVSGSFSRTAVNYATGGVTGLSTLFTGLVVVLVLLFFTPLLYHMPKATLAAVVVMAVIGLVSARSVIKMWHVRKDDAVVAVVVFAATLYTAPHLEVGISVGVLLSIALVLIRQMKPKTSVLSFFADGSYRDADRRGLKRCEHILLLRFNGALFFANAIYLEDRLLEEVAKMPKLRHIIIVGNGINEIDVGGEEVLSQLFKKLRYDGYGVHVSGANDAVRDVIRRSELAEVINEENLFPNVRIALKTIRERSKVDPKAAPLCEPEECPLSRVVQSSTTEEETLVKK